MPYALGDSFNFTKDGAKEQKGSTKGKSEKLTHIIN